MDETCSLCGCEKETHKHLFFECSYSATVWSAVWRKPSSARVPTTLGALLEWFVQSIKGDGFKSRIMKCSLATTVYFIWKERNLRVFQQKAVTSDQVVLTILNSIRDLLSSMRRVKASLENKGLCVTWGLAEHFILKQ